MVKQRVKHRYIVELLMVKAQVDYLKECVCYFLVVPSEVHIASYQRNICMRLSSLFK